MKYARRLYTAAITSSCVLAFGCGDDPVARTADAMVDAIDATADGSAQPVDATVDSGAPIAADAEMDMGRVRTTCSETVWEWSAEGLTLRCEGSAVTLAPTVKIAGEWREPIECTPGVDEVGLQCSFATLGTVRAQALSGGQVQLTVAPDTNARLEALGWSGTAVLPGARAWLSNGFQSWSQTGVLALQTEADPTLASAIAALGDVEVIRNGSAQSWWYSFVQGDALLVAGATSAHRFKSWLQFYGTDDALTVRLISGATGESVVLSPGEEVSGETWYLGLGDDGHRLLEAYGDVVPTRETSTAVPEAGWNSWYELWNTVDAEAVLANAALAATILSDRLPEGAPPLRIVIDDGWQQAWGDWSPNEKFPEGVASVAASLQADGFTTGIWLAPLLVEPNSEIATQHPEWLVRDAYYSHANEGEMLILDVTHPEVEAHLRETITRIVGWGFDLLKIDFLFAGTFEGGRTESVTGMEAYRRALTIIREAAGAETVLLAVGAPAVAGFDLVDAWRIGPDIAVENFGATWFFLPGEARTIAGRWPFCRAVLCDGDPPILRDMSPTEVETGGWIAAFAGGAWFLSDDLRHLPEERWAWFSPEMVATALAGVPSFPDPLVPDILPDVLTTALFDYLGMQSDHQVPSRWVTPTGAMRINFGDEAREIEGVRVPARTTVVEE